MIPIRLRMRFAPLKFNPFEIVEHNQWHQSRLFFHASHAAIGLPVAVIAWLLHLPLAFSIAAATALAFADKCLWIDWAHRQLHWSMFDVKAPHDWADFTSDLGLTVMGAIAPALLVAHGWSAALITLVAYYVLSVFNGT